MGIMLVYDATNEKSFENIKNWIRNIEENASADVEKMLLGNKCELIEKRQVSKERGEQLAVEYGIKFMETSAKSSINVEEAFYTLARDIKAKMEKKLVNTFLLYILLNIPSFIVDVLKCIKNFNSYNKKIKIIQNILNCLKYIIKLEIFCFICYLTKCYELNIVISLPVGGDCVKNGLCFFK